MNVAIFTGAGASKPLGLPVMGEMVDDSWRNNLPDELTALYDIAANWASAESDDNTVDFELLYTAIHSFSEMELTDLVAVPFAPHRGNAGLRYHGHPNKIFDFSKAKKHAAQLRTRLEELVHDEVGEVSGSESWQYYKPLLRTMRTLLDNEGDSAELQIFTTNYDRAIESIFWERVPEEEDYSLRLVDGFPPSELGMGPPQFDDEVFDRQPKEGELLLKLYKLHGSVHWVRRNSRVIRSGTDDYNERNAVIYPLRRHKQGMPFDILRRRFERALKNDSDTLVAIGSSFRDDHIRELVTRCMNAKTGVKNLLLVGPEAGQVALRLVQEGVREEFVDTIEKKFGSDETIDALTEYLQELVERR